METLLALTILAALILGLVDHVSKSIGTYKAEKR